MKYLQRALTNIPFLYATPTKINFLNELQEAITDKRKYFNSTLTSLNNLLNCLKDFNMRVDNLSNNLDIEIISKDEKKINFLIKKIFKTVRSKFEESINFLEGINSQFSMFIKNLNEEIKIYKDFNEINNEFKKEKIKFKNSEDIYYKSGQEMEYRLIQFISNNIHSLNHIYENEFLREELDQILNPAIFGNQNYMQNLKNINEVIDNYNEKQSKYYNFLQEILAKDDVFYYNLINNYANFLENEEKNLIKEIKEIKNSNQQKDISEFKKLVEDTEKNKIEENKINIEHYPTQLEFNKCKSKIEFEVYFECINIIKKYVDNKIFPDYNYDIELRNYKMVDIVKNLFNQKGKINQSLADSFLDLIEYPSVYRAFFVILSKLRSSGTFAQNEHVISLLGQGFNVILSKAKKNKSYDDVKNIIILSQTYYYESENKEKIYLFEFIKNNEWLKSGKFWRNFIQDSIEKDLQRFDNSFYKNKLENKNKNKKDDINMEKKLNEIVFSQLLTYSNNMKNFEIDKRVIIKIIDEFIEKYKYVSENNIQMVFEMIVPEKEGEKYSEEMLNKLRTEYNISLENNKVDEIEDKKEDEKEDKKEEEKEDKKEEEKEDKKEEEKEDKTDKKEEIKVEENKDNNENIENINNEK